MRRMSAGPLLRTARRAGRIGHRRRVGSAGIGGTPVLGAHAHWRTRGAAPGRLHRVGACPNGRRLGARARRRRLGGVVGHAHARRGCGRRSAGPRRAVATAASRQPAAPASPRRRASSSRSSTTPTGWSPTHWRRCRRRWPTGVDVAYSDHDVIDAAGFYVDPVYKPDFSPERLRSQNYVTRLLVARRSLLDVVGGFRDGLDGAEDHDLVLRLTEAARSVAHVPRVLYHCRQSAPSAAGGSGSRRGRPPPAPGRSPTIAPVRASTPPSRRRRGRGATASSGEWQHGRSSAW